MRPLFLKEYLFFIRIATSCLILKTLFANLAIVCHLDPTLSKCYNEGCYLGVLKMLIATVLTTSATTFSLRTIAFCYGGCSKNWISSRSVFLLTSFSSRYLSLSLLKSKTTAQACTFLMNSSSMLSGGAPAVIASLKVRGFCLRSWIRGRPSSS